MEIAVTCVREHPPVSMHPFSTRAAAVRRLRPLALALALAVAAGNAAVAAPSGAAMEPAGQALKALYWQGHDALKQADWSAALERFTDLEARLRSAEPDSTDAAIYWQAYALAQAGRRAEARSAVERLRREFPDSRWIGDATALLATASDARVAAPAAIEDEELAEMAIQGLLSAPAARAAPLLRGVLEGQHSIKLKKRALFVLSQIDDAGALDTVIGVARSGEPALQREAVQMLGVSGSERAVAALAQLYAGAPAPLRRDILGAWLVADEKERVLAAARSETDPGVRRKAIDLLGAMDAGQELQVLYRESTDAEMRRRIVRALGIGNAVDPLVAIARSDADQAVRVEALHALGVADAGPALAGLYASADTPELRDAVLQGLMIAGHSEGLLQVYRNARTTEEKKAALRMLTLVGDGTALDLIEDTLRQTEGGR